MNCNLQRLVMVALSLLLIPAITKAHVNGPGPSDPALFDTVINLPPAPNIGNFGSIGVYTRQTFQLNVMDGGSVGEYFDANSVSEVNISGGTVGSGFDAWTRSEVNISGGSVGSSFGAYSYSEVNISGGSVGSGFDAYSDSVVNISGGSVGSGFDANSGSVVNISGGNVGSDFDAFPGSEVNLLGTKFLLDGVLLESLVTGEAFTITERDVTLSGLLADGTPFDFDHNGTFSVPGDFFAPGSTLTVTLVVPEPGSLLLGTLASVGMLRRRRRLSQLGIVSCHRSANQRI